MKITKSKKAFTISNLSYEDLVEFYHSNLPIKIRRQVYQALLESLDECQEEYGVTAEEFLGNINIFAV